jgi:hypothetical protein
MTTVISNSSRVSVCPAKGGSLKQKKMNVGGACIYQLGSLSRGETERKTMKSKGNCHLLGQNVFLCLNFTSQKDRYV